MLQLPSHLLRYIQLCVWCTAWFQWQLKFRFCYLMITRAIIFSESVTTGDLIKWAQNNQARLKPMHTIIARHAWSRKSSSSLALVGPSGSAPCLWPFWPVWDTLELGQYYTNYRLIQYMKCITWKSQWTSMISCSQKVCNPRFQCRYWSIYVLRPRPLFEKL